MAGCFGGCFARLMNGRQERKRFLDAAKHGANEVGALMNSNPNVVTSTTFLAKKNALHLAAEEGHITVLSSILEALLCQASLGTTDVATQIADLINSQDSEGRTPLLMACSQGHVECARFLLANGARRAIADGRGNTPVHYAAAKGHLGILFMLLGEFLDELSEQQAADEAAGVHPGGRDERGSGNSARPRRSGSHEGNTRASGVQGTVAGESAIDALLPGNSERADVVRLADARNSAGFSPLHFAVWAKQSAAVQVLLQHGADLLAKNLRSGADSSIPCPGGCTPLHLAAMRGHVEISRILLKTYCERVLEPMQVQAGTGPAAAALARSLTALDPRTQLNAAGHVAYQVAQRMGYVSLAVLLRPNIPLMRLFSEEERAARFYGPPPLAILAAEALNRKLLAALDALPPAVVHPQPQRAPSQLSKASRAPGNGAGLPTVQEVEEDGMRMSPGRGQALPLLLPSQEARVSSSGVTSPGAVAVGIAGTPSTQPVAPWASGDGPTITLPGSPRASDSAPALSPFAAVSGASPGRSLAAAPPAGTQPWPLPRQASARSLSNGGAAHEAAVLMDALAVAAEPPLVGLPGQPEGPDAAALASAGLDNATASGTAPVVGIHHNGSATLTPISSSPAPAAAAAPGAPGLVHPKPQHAFNTTVQIELPPMPSATSVPMPLTPSPGAPAAAAPSIASTTSTSTQLPSSSLTASTALPAAAAPPAPGLLPRTLTSPGRVSNSGSTGTLRPASPALYGMLSPGHGIMAGRAPSLGPTRLSFSGTATQGQAPPMAVPGIGTVYTASVASHFGTPLPGSPVPGGPMPPNALQHQHSSLNGGIPPGVVALTRGSSITLLGAAAAAQRLALAPAQSLPQSLALAAEDVVTHPEGRGLPGCLPRFDGGVPALPLPPDLEAMPQECCNPAPDGTPAPGNSGMRRTGSGTLPLPPGATEAGPSVLRVNRAGDSSSLQRQPSGGVLIHVGPGAPGEPSQRHALSRAASHSNLVRAQSGTMPVVAAGTREEGGTHAAGPDGAASVVASSAVVDVGAAARTAQGTDTEGGFSIELIPAVAGGAAAAVAAAAAGLDPVGYDEDDECGVCMEHPAFVLIQPCMHTICGPCAHKMCSLNLQRSPHCPFCRAMIGNYGLNVSKLKGFTF